MDLVEGNNAAKICYRCGDGHPPGKNSLRLVKKLESFITPSARHENQESLEELKERVAICE